VSSRGEWGRASSRRLPPLILLLLAAVAIAMGPALGARTGTTAADVADSAAFPAAEDAHAGFAGSHGDERQGTHPAPSRAGLRHTSVGAAALERPTFDAVPPAVTVAGPLLALVVGYGGNERRRGRTLLSASARSPPASLV
jgi:hypothetical protein